MSNEGDVITRNLWPVGAVLALAGTLCMLLSAGLLLGAQFKFAGIAGAACFILMGIAIMWKNEHLLR